MHNYSCFVISPIGDVGSEIRQNADDVLEYLITPALRNCGFCTDKIIRADQLVTSGYINNDIIQLIRDSDLCIIDVTGKNPNVMYECGMRHGNGKPYVMIAKKNEDLPFDIAGIRTIMYDLSSLRACAESRKLLEQFVDPLIERGFVRDEGTDSISSIAESLRTLEKKVDALISQQSDTPISNIANPELDDVLTHLSPIQAFNYALSTRDATLAEQLLPKVKPLVSKNYFIDHAIAQAAALGSTDAAQYIKENWFYITTNLDEKQQYDCIASYVSYCNHKDAEEENLAFFEECCNSILNADSSIEVRAGLFNQRNRMYYGAYTSTNKTNPQYRNKALDAIECAISLMPTESSYYFNQATIVSDTDPFKAAELLEKCLKLDESPDEDHLLLAYKMYVQTNNPDAKNVLKQLQKINPFLAKLAQRK